MEREGEIGPDRFAEHALADHHRQDRGVQRDDLARPVHQHVAVLRRQLTRADVTLPGTARPEPVTPGPAQGVVAGNRDVRPERLPDVLADLDAFGAHRDPRTVQGLFPDREDRFPDLLALQRREFGDLRPPPGRQRGGVRVILGLGFPGPRPQWITAAEPRVDLQ